MRYAIIENGVVINVAESGEQFAAAQGWIDAAGAAIGDLWDGLVFTKPARDIVADKADKWEAIKAERDLRKSSGYRVGALWFHADDGSRIQQLGLLMMGAGIPAGMQWKTLDGTFVTMTPTLAGQIFSAAAASDQAIFAKAEWHKSQMEASASPADYDFSGGWPAQYEGA